MSKPKTIERRKDGYRTIWRNGPRGSGEIHVDVYDESDPDTPILEWAFPRVAGNALIGNVAIFLDQALIYAREFGEKPATTTEDT